MDLLDVVYRLEQAERGGIIEENALHPVDASRR